MPICEINRLPDKNPLMDLPRKAYALYNNQKTAQYNAISAHTTDLSSPTSFWYQFPTTNNPRPISIAKVILNDRYGCSNGSES